jgi:hydrogenase maturation protease
MSWPETQMANSPAPRQARIVVIGFGSPIRGDDALGPLAADQLADQLTGPQVDVFSRHILSAEMAEQLQDATLVLFLDASVDGPRGVVVERELEPRRDNHDVLAHSVDPAGLLAWTSCLYGHTPSARLLSVRAATLDYAHYQLSPQVRHILPRLLSRVHELVREHLRDAANL